MVSAAGRRSARRSRSGEYGFAALIIPLLSLARPLPLILASGLAAALPSFGLGEDVLKFGGEAGWKQFSLRNGLAELENVRPTKVLALSSAEKSDDPSLDMALSFDEGGAELFTDSVGNYRLLTSGTVYTAGSAWARFGDGAAVFSSAPGMADEAAKAPVVINARSAAALFSVGRNIGDFSLEFWLYPASMENGEEALSWTSAVRDGGVYKNQSLGCAVSKNRIEWNIKNFFFAPKTEEALSVKSMDLRLVSSAPLVPKRWSHQLLRFDGTTGLLEYLVDGVLEDLAYTTPSGAEGGDVFLPLIGERGNFILGKRFNGMIDNFRVYKRFVEQAGLRPYSRSGSVRSAPIDLGGRNSTVLRVDASGGTYGALNGERRGVSAHTGNFDFPGGAQIQFFIRASDSPYSWEGAAWRAFTPGEALGSVRGRYIELAADFYPGGDFETTPFLEELSVVFARKAAPEPPPYIRAAAKDGGVELSWVPSKDEATAGYIVYYGAASGNYLGEGASAGPSPIDAGKRLSVSIDKLTNGILYYFSVSSYDDLGQAGDYSREVSARPLRMSK
ncbi:MAG: hypothetical protein LBD86_04210 [Spirochaetaceae bacterium]|nr:hypothetical protein [Spirochaetaceae bacterium]